MTTKAWPSVWQDLGSAAADALDGRNVKITGFLHPLRYGEKHTGYFALAADAACCIGCLPRAPERRIEILARHPMNVTGSLMRLAGRFRVIDDVTSGWRYQLEDAHLMETGGLSRRRMLTTASLSCAAVVCSPAHALASPDDNEAAMQAIAGATTIDIHTHAGGIAVRRFVDGSRAAYPVASPMRIGGMSVACLAVVSDGPTHKVSADGRIHPFRTPAPGELYQYGTQSFTRLHQLEQATQWLRV